MIHRFLQRERKKVFSREVLFSVIRNPLVTERSTMGQQQGCYYFSVATWASKIVIKKAVEELFSVSVRSVRTSRLKGKTKQFRGRVGQRSDMKKAFVSLMSGQKLNIEQEIS